MQYNINQHNVLRIFNEDDNLICIITSSGICKTFDIDKKTDTVILKNGDSSIQSFSYKDVYLLYKTIFPHDNFF